MTTKVEEGIRAYLESLNGSKGKPKANREAVKALTAQIKAETDPLNKLKLLAQREEERAGKAADDNSGLEAVFVAEAQKWADKEGVPVEAFRAMKVPDDVLIKAGFKLTAKPTTRATKGTGTRVALLFDDVVKACPATGTFTIRQVADKLGRSTAVVRNKIIDLVEQGVMVDKGDDPSHDGRGRAPKLYELKK